MSPTSTSDPSETPAPARAGVAALLGHFALDLGLYLALTLVLSLALAAATLRHEPFKPRFSGPHWVSITLSPCQHGVPRDEALLAVLRSHGSVSAEVNRRGEALPISLFDTFTSDGVPQQFFMAQVSSPTGTPLQLTKAEISAATDCPVETLAYGPIGERLAERFHLAPATVALGLLGSLLAAGVAWAWRRPGRGIPLARGGAGAAVAVALLAALGSQALPAFAAALGLPLAPSNRQAIEALVGAWPVFASVALVLGAPLAEEAFFRGVLLRRFLLAGRPGLGLLLTSGLFALAHELFADGPWTQTLSTTAVYAAMGLLFGAVYLRTGRLWAAVLAHAVANAAGLAMLAYSTA